MTSPTRRRTIRNLRSALDRRALEARRAVQRRREQLRIAALERAGRAIRPALPRARLLQLTRW